MLYNRLRENWELMLNVNVLQLGSMMIRVHRILCVRNVIVDAGLVMGLELLIV